MKILKTIYSIIFLPSVFSFFTTNNGNILLNDEPYHISGLSWFGFETQDWMINGLWSHDMDFYLDLIKSLKINTLRIPFSAEWIYYNYDIYPWDGNIVQDPSLKGKKSIEVLDELFDKTKERDIYILLDLHRLHKEYISELWYSSTDNLYTVDIYYETWFKILDRYSNRTNLLGVDLLNEPHGSATYGNNDFSTDWHAFVNSAIPIFEKRYPNHSWLFFVEGINWGHYFPDDENLLFANQQLVYSPHIYGKSVVPSTSDDRYTLYAQWDGDFGFLWKKYKKVIVPGEWGGRTDIDRDWMIMFTDYLVENNIRNNFFWSLGPNSGDVQGLLLDDWTNVDGFKSSIIQKMQ